MTNVVYETRFFASESRHRRAIFYLSRSFLRSVGNDDDS